MRSLTLVREIALVSDEQKYSPATWKEIVSARRELFLAPTNENAGKYKEIVGRAQASPPYHILPILRQLELIQKRTGKSRSKIKILDHGCGGGGTLMFLAASGYTDVHGVEIGGTTGKTDLALRTISDADAPRIQVYDGFTLPFPDKSIDLIFSQQVMEHVEDRFIESYIDEEVRILNDEGIVYHQIPHRWTPWESHTKTWLIHYLPRIMRRQAYKLFGHDPDYIEKMLHLRSPVYFYQKFRRVFPKHRNETLERIALCPDPAYYEGNLRLRSLVAQLAKFPIIRNIIVHFVMIDLTASRSSASQ